MIVKFNESLAPYTHYHIGGIARDVYFPETASECAEIFHRLNSEVTPYFTLGGGSNVLVGDGYWDGAVVVLRELKSIHMSDSSITCGAGVQSTKIAEIANEQKKTGLEFLYLLPGTIGGAVAMNARYDNINVSDVLIRLTACHPADGLREIHATEIDFSYKYNSIIGEGWIICDVTLKWAPGNPDTIHDRMNAIEEQRNNSHQFEYPSAGCIFQNDHANNIQVGRLLDSLGLKETRIGDAVVAPFHANFIINRGHATASDVRSLIELIEHTVLDQTGISLKREVQLVGTFI